MHIEDMRRSGRSRLCQVSSELSERLSEVEHRPWREAAPASSRTDYTDHCEAALSSSNNA